MKANAMREKVKLKQMKVIYSTFDQVQQDGLLTPHTGRMASSSRFGSLLPGREASRDGSEFDDDVESGYGSRSASRVRLVR